MDFTYFINGSRAAFIINTHNPLLVVLRIGLCLAVAKFKTNEIKMYCYYVKETLQTCKRLLFLPVIKWNIVVSSKGHIRSFGDAMIRNESEIQSTEMTFNKLTSVFYASVLLLIINFVITLSK